MNNKKIYNIWEHNNENASKEMDCKESDSVQSFRYTSNLNTKQKIASNIPFSKRTLNM